MVTSPTQLFLGHEFCKHESDRRLMAMAMSVYFEAMKFFCVVGKGIERRHRLRAKV